MSTKVVLAKFWPFVHSLPLDPPPAPATKSPTSTKAESGATKAGANIFAYRHCKDGVMPGVPLLEVLTSREEHMDFGPPRPGRRHRTGMTAIPPQIENPSNEDRLSMAIQAFLCRSPLSGIDSDPGSLRHCAAP
jgi:hypothetical protein